MARPHIDYFHAQQLPWETGAYASLPGVQSKTLSVDDETGACTVILRYPPGWRMEGPWHLPEDVEFYLLDGKFELNGQLYTLDCYGFLPAGWVSESAVTETGADIITFFEGRPDFVKGRPHEGQYDLSLAIPYKNTFDMPWTTDGLGERLGRLPRVAAAKPPRRARHTAAGTARDIDPSARQAPDPGLNAEPAAKTAGSARIGP